MAEVSLFSLPPRRARNFHGIGAPGNNGRHRFAEFQADLLKARFSTSVFNRIVEKGTDGFRFVSSMFQDDGGDSEEVRDEWHLGFFSDLTGMNPVGIHQCFLEFG